MDAEMKRLEELARQGDPEALRGLVRAWRRRGDDGRAAAAWAKADPWMHVYWEASLLAVEEALLHMAAALEGGAHQGSPEVREAVRLATVSAEGSVGPAATALKALMRSARDLGMDVYAEVHVRGRVWAMMKLDELKAAREGLLALVGVAYDEVAERVPAISL